jgi:hypothetical protein
MTLQLNNYAEEYRKIIKLADGSLTHSPRKEGDEWVYTKVEGAFTLDFLTMTHGWRKFPLKGSGLPTQFEITPAETVWTQEQANEMKANGWKFLVIAKVASREFGGLAEIHAVEPALITAINELFHEFLVHPDSTEGTVPVITHEVDAFGEQRMVIQGFRPRADKVFGKPCNTLPERTQEPVEPKAAPSAPAKPQETPTVSPTAPAATVKNQAFHDDMVAKMAARKAANEAAKSNCEAAD